jgi:hypothetical protein
MTTLVQARITSQQDFPEVSQSPGGLPGFGRNDFRLPSASFTKCSRFVDATGLPDQWCLRRENQRKFCVSSLSPQPY